MDQSEEETIEHHDPEGTGDTNPDTEAKSEGEINVDEPNKEEQDNTETKESVIEKQENKPTEEGELEEAGKKEEQLADVEKTDAIQDQEEKENGEQQEGESVPEEEEDEDAAQKLETSQDQEEKEDSEQREGESVPEGEEDKDVAEKLETIQDQEEKEDGEQQEEDPVPDKEEDADEKQETSQDQDENEDSEQRDGEDELDVSKREDDTSQINEEEENDKIQENEEGVATKEATVIEEEAAEKTEEADNQETNEEASEAGNGQKQNETAGVDDTQPDKDEMTEETGEQSAHIKLKSEEEQEHDDQTIEETHNIEEIGGDTAPKEMTDFGSDMPKMDHQPHPTMETSMGTEVREGTQVTDATQADNNKAEATATVKLILVPNGQVVTMSMTLGTTPKGIRDTISKELKVPSSVIQVLFNGRALEDKFSIAELGIEANDTVAFELASSDPENHPLKTYSQTKPADMADVITVRIPFDDGQIKDAIVEIERTSRKKPFIGGYRHKKTGKEYHHGTSQTYAPSRPPPNIERYSRDTQTTQQQHRVQQTFNTTSTQMSKPGVFVSNLADKLVVPRKYETADEYRARMLKKVIIIQTFYRRWLAKRKVHKLRKIRDQCQNFEEEVEIKKRKEKEDRIHREFERRMNPKSKEDFDLLYGALEKWRQEEMTRINGTVSGAERKAAMCLLLEQETELIAAIDRHQLDASTDNKEKKIQRLLGRAAAPKKWKTENGCSLQMDTSYTLRGKELLDIYNSLNMKYLTQDERLDVLLTLKHTVKEHDCKLTHEIIELIDREADLLMRGVKEDNLNGLRKRLTTLFLQYCKTPTFNPEITHLLKVPQDPSSLRQDIYYCHSCGRYLQATAFNLGIKSTGMGRCRACLRKDNLARVRQDLSAYKHLLQKLRKQEEAYQDGARIAFLIEEADLRYLVENTWESMSILSSWNDLADLEMVRWRVEEEWSPWNAVLLTRDEVEAHMKIKTKLDEAYGDMLAHRVSQKHVLAKNYFSQLESMATKMPKNLHSKSSDDTAANNAVEETATN